MKKLTHKDFRLGLRKWNWRFKNYDYSLYLIENDKRMIQDIPELEKYEDDAYCTFCAKFADRNTDCKGCPFPKDENCFLERGTIYDRWFKKCLNSENASAETAEMVQLIRRLYKEWKNEKKI